MSSSSGLLERISKKSLLPLLYYLSSKDPWDSFISSNKFLEPLLSTPEASENYWRPKIAREISYEIPRGLKPSQRSYQAQYQSIQAYRGPKFSEYREVHGEDPLVAFLDLGDRMESWLKEYLSSEVGDSLHVTLDNGIGLLILALGSFSAFELFEKCDKRSIDFKLPIKWLYIDELPCPGAYLYREEIIPTYENFLGYLGKFKDPGELSTAKKTLLTDLPWTLSHSHYVDVLLGEDKEILVKELLRSTEDIGLFDHYYTLIPSLNRLEFLREVFEQAGTFEAKAEFFKSLVDSQGAELPPGFLGFNEYPVWYYKEDQLNYMIEKDLLDRFDYEEQFMRQEPRDRSRMFLDLLLEEEWEGNISLYLKENFEKLLKKQEEGWLKYNMGYYTTYLEILIPYLVPEQIERIIEEIRAENITYSVSELLGAILERKDLHGSLRDQVEKSRSS